MEYLKDVVELWLKELERCRKSKERHFGKTADLLRGFMGKSYTELYIDVPEDSELKTDDNPHFKPRLNKTREFVSVVCPFVHAKIPNRKVTPRRPPVPEELVVLAQAYGLPDVNTQASIEDKVQAFLLEWWLNYTPGETGAMRQQRQIIEECLVTGRGVGWHEMAPGPTGPIPGTFYDTVDSLFIDADCRQWREANFIFRERRWPAWQLADLWKVDIEKLRAARKRDLERQKTDDVRTGTDGGDESDVCVWYELSSRMGMGNRLYKANETVRGQAEALESLGQHVYMAFLPGLDYPLNMPNDIWQVADRTEIEERFRWPIAFFTEASNPFGCTPMDIYPSTDSPWAHSPLEGAIPLQVFLDRMYSLLMGRVRSTCRDIIVTAKELEKAVRAAIKEGADQIVVPAAKDQVEEMAKLIHIIQFPELNADAWQILHQVERAFEQSTGMDPLLYGSEGARQIRSAEEANVRSSNVQSRPGDYADAVEAFNSASAAKELQMARMYVPPSTVAPLFREPVTEDESQYGPLTLLWSALVNTDDPAEAAADLHVQVEAGSGQRKNRQKMTQDLNTVGQTLMPVMQMYAQAGDPSTLNAFVEMMAENIEVPLGRLKFQPLIAQGGEEEEVDEAEENQKDRDASMDELVLTLETKLKEARIKADATKSRGKD
jgi:hypothetical protein